MADFTLNDIGNVLKRIQAPGGSADVMRQFLPGLEQNVRGAIPNPRAGIVDSMKSKYMDQIHQIAAMDQKLASLYGDPTSKLYIAKGSTRQGLLSSASNTGYRAAGDMRSSIRSE